MWLFYEHLVFFSPLSWYFFFNLLIFPSQRIRPDLLVFSLLMDSSGFCIITLVFYWLPIISCVSNVLALTVKYWEYICWFLSHQEYFKFTSVSALWIMQVQVDALLFQSIQVKELSSIQHIYTHFACSLFDIVWYICWLSWSFYSKKMSLIKISGLENAWKSRILLQLYLILICMKYGTQKSKNILLYVLKTNLWFEFETSACNVGTFWFWCYISGSCWNDHCPPVYLLLI